MMKRLITKGILTVAAALFTMSALAAGKVEVVGDTSHGTVTSEANGAVVTLTVTPAEGYYIRKSDITVTKTFMPVFEAASRRANVPVSDMLTLAGADPEDLSAPRTYTVTMPGEEYDLMVDVRYTSRQGITEAMVSLSETVFVYNEQIQRPTVSVQGLREGTDYTVTYSNAASQEPDTYSVTVKGISAWHGTITRTYKIFMGGKAEVNTKIAGGTIATSVDGLTMTMTVTPAEGYYIRKEDVVVAKTYLPVAAAPARRSIPVADQLAIEGDDPENLSLARTYTVQLPGWEFSAYVDAVFTERQTVTDRMVTLSATSFIYNGNDQKPEVTVDGLTEGKDYLLDFEGTSWSDVATYTLTVTGRSTWKGVVSKTYTIVKAPAVVTQAPEALTLTYNGEEQQLLSAGDAIGGILMYSTDGTDYQTAIPTAIAAGSYTLYYMVVGDANHSDSQPVAVTVSVTQKDITVSGIAAQDKVYDGTTVATLIFDAVAFDGLLEGDTLSVTAEGSFADKNVGADKVVNIRELTLGGESIANYLLAAAGQQSEATASIGKKDITISGIVAQDKDYDGTIEATLDYDAVVYDGIVEGDMLSVVAEGSFADANVGADKEVTISGLALDGESIANYQLAVTGQQTVTTASIGQVPSVMTKAPEALTLTYNGAAQLLLTAGEAAGGAMAYSTDGTDFQTEIPTATDAGTYTLYYKVVGDANHSDTEVFTMEASIVAKAIDTPVIALEEAEYVYDGKAKEPLVVSVKAGDAVIPATEYAVSYHQNVNAGQAEVIVADLEGGNYTVAGSATFTIGKALLTVTAKDKRMFVNEKVPELTLAYEGFANKENEDDLTVVPMATTTATPESEPDVYDIVVSGGEAVNYDFAYVSGQLTVLVPEFVSEEGLGVEAEVVTDGETGETVAVITELPNSFWEGTGDIPTTLTDGEGNEYEVTQVDAAAFDAMESDVIVVLPEGLTTTEAVTNVINGDGSCETLDLTDISNLNLPIDVEAETVVYTREVEADEELITVCLPYELHVPDNTTAYTLNDADEGGITLEEHKGDMEAFQPYVLSINTPSQARRRNSGTAPVTVDLGATNVSIASTKEEGATKMNGFVLRGSLRSMTHQEGYAMRAYSMQPDGSWAMTASAEPKMAGKQYLGAFQAYLIYEGDDEPESISTTLREASLTSIPLTNVSTANDDNGWYDLMGRKLTGKQPRKGIYLHHGKRIVNWR